MPSVELNRVDTVVPFDDAVRLTVASDEGSVVRKRSVAGKISRSKIRSLCAIPTLKLKEQLRYDIA